jgi:type I restriction enzyme, R subunit
MAAQVFKDPYLFDFLGTLNMYLSAVDDLLRHPDDTQGFPLDRIMDQTGFERNAAIRDAKEVVNQNDETRKRFEIMAREVFKKFKACITLPRINDHRHAYNAINIIYKSLQEDREKADITDIIRELHAVVDEAIEPLKAKSVPDPRTYDISKIDFDRLRKEFEGSPQKNTSVQCLKSVVENRLARMIEQNPLRMDLQRHYEEIIAAYNQEKDQVTIEKTFDELLQLSQSLDHETQRAVQEGLDEESLALFDLLLKPDLAKKDIDRIKKVAQELLARLKAELTRIENWRAREATRDAIRAEIKDFLWNDQIGLPLASFTEDEVIQKAEQVYLHIFRVYDGPDPAVYAKAG